MDHVTHFKPIWVKLFDNEIDFFLLFFFWNGSYTKYYMGFLAERMPFLIFPKKK